PEDTEPLREAARRLAAGGFDDVLFTTAIQIAHLARVARDLGMEEAVLHALRKCRVCSIGPTTTEALEEFGIHPALEPSHPKMGSPLKDSADLPCSPRAQSDIASPPSRTSRAIPPEMRSQFSVSPASCWRPFRVIEQNFPFRLFSAVPQSAEIHPRSCSR